MQKVETCIGHLAPLGTLIPLLHACWLQKRDFDRKQLHKVNIPSSINIPRVSIFIVQPNNPLKFLWIILILPCILIPHHQGGGSCLPKCPFFHPVVCLLERRTILVSDTPWSSALPPDPTNWEKELMVSDACVIQGGMGRSHRDKRSIVLHVLAAKVLLAVF